MCGVGYYEDERADRGAADSVKVDGSSGAILDFGFWRGNLGI